MNRNLSQKGVSLVEIILAIALFGIFATALIFLLINSYDSNLQAEEKDKATFYAQQGMEAVWSIRRRAWNLLENGDHGLDNAGGYWEFSGTSDLLGEKYTRVVTIADVCRSSGDIVDCPTGTVDPHTKKVTSVLTYTSINGISNEIILDSYLTLWQSKSWIQTDWSGGSGQAEWSDEFRYYMDDSNISYSTNGEIKLASSGVGSCGVKIWSFDTAGDYTYDTNDIEVTGGFAQLKSEPGPPAYSQTTNSGFDTTLNPWTTGSWGTVNPRFSRPTGGNPGRYARINFPNTRNQVSGGYYQQQFTVTQSDVISADLSLDWRVVTATRVPDSLILYAFVDTAPGTPIIGQEVWSSGNLTSTTNWNTVSNIDVSVQVSGPGTYYLKVVAYLDYQTSRSASYRVGFDNVLLVYSYHSNPTYPTNNPPIYPNGSYAVDDIDSWSSFSEAATKNGGEIYYQLSDDDGANWQYWDGSSWSTAGANDYNTASVINANILEFSTSTSQIMFKAFLESDSTQLVQLDEIRIGCSQYYDWPFSSEANYTYDAGKIEVTGGAAQMADQGGGHACSGTATACSTHSNQNSCQGQSGCLWLAGTPSSTTNPGFSTTLTPWVTGSWGTVNPRFSRPTGGNPGRYARINFPNTRNQVSGGYFEQSFTTAGAAAVATLSFDWLVNRYTGPADTLHLYVFVDSTSGEPTIGQEVWDSGDITGTISWTSVNNLDVASKITGAGTYYLKIVAYIDYRDSGANRSYRVGYDNVLLSWAGDGDCLGTATACDTFGDQTSCEGQDGCSWVSAASYPTDRPAIYPNDSYNASGVSEWSVFDETATKNGGEIYYQLSDDDGATWQYWDGSSWSTAGASDYNAASAVSSSISEFSTTTGKIMFKAFLESDGSQQVQLDNVRIGWGEMIGSGYATSGWLESSAFNTGGPSAFNFLSWTEVLPSANEDIQCQIATAPDDSGSPGIWTDWLGPGGAGTYYTSGDEIMFPLSNDHNDGQWVKYKIYLTGDGSDTPVLEEIKVNYTP